MPKTSLQQLCTVALAGVALAPPVSAATVDGIIARTIATGLDQPIFLTHAPGDRDNLYIVGKTGSVRVLDRATGQLHAEPMFSVPDLTTDGERGLLGMAFDPGYERNGHIYINYTDGSGDTRIDRVNTLGGAPTLSPVMRMPQPASNHNGGFVGFSPRDGQLYIATGDGGGGNDAFDNAQDLTSPLGKVLRIDPSRDAFPDDAMRNYAIPGDNPFAGAGGDTREEIWAYGLRNPFRASFDRETGDLWLGDVGQGEREEINHQPADSSGGENYGWSLREGDIATPRVGGERPTDNVDPVFDYQHGAGAFEGFSVTGGYVYRGPIKALQGEYFFADFVSGGVWSFSLDDEGEPKDLTDWTETLGASGADLRGIASFGEDALGNLFIVNIGGDVYEIAAVPLPPALWLFGGALGLLAACRRRG